MTGMGVGIALAAAPGAVQAVLVSEAVRGGVQRGVRALVGASFTFGCLLFAVALGLATFAPPDWALRLLKAAGGALLVWLGFDAFLSEPTAGERSSTGWASLPPTARGSLAVLLNPGAWLFIAAVASPLLATAERTGGLGVASLTALALMAGAATGDSAIVAIAGIGLRHGRKSTRLFVTRILALLLGGLGVFMIAGALAP
jgi:threonine/homoserine/homoserine lactone efflux protein